LNSSCCRLDLQSRRKTVNINQSYTEIYLLSIRTEATRVRYIPELLIGVLSKTKKFTISV
jgi:hypothetical protein